MLAELDRHPHARAVLQGAMEPGGSLSHAYLFYGPGGSGKRAAARALAAELLSAGSPDPDSARARVRSGAHPDLTWVSPSGAHEMLVSDIDGPVVGAASRTPFEAARRVFVIERADELGDEAANRMLKTLEEPAVFVHLILLTNKLGEVMPTIRSRCQLVRFDPPPLETVAASLSGAGVTGDEALACARLALGDADVARELAGPPGRSLRAAAERFARAGLAGEMGSSKPWADVLKAAADRGQRSTAELQERAQGELELYPRRERRRIENEWVERIRRVRRRIETSSLDLALAVVGMWYADLAALAWDARELVRNVDRRGDLEQDQGVDPLRLMQAVGLVEETRMRFLLNVSEELACEALAYRLEEALGR